MSSEETTETPAEEAVLPPVAPAPMSLMEQLAAMSISAGAVKKEATDKTEELGRKVVKQRRKSRELEQEVFGMNLTEVAALRKKFDEIDLDSSGTIETDELLEALKKCGKNPTNEQTKELIATYDKGAKGNLTFDEFQLMIAEWKYDAPSMAPAAAPA